MAFNTLLDRFEERSKDIYGRFSAKESAGDQPYVSIRPGSKDANEEIRGDIRLLPLSESARRDRTRVSKFLKSPAGLRFTAKQLLLQTGNTFSNQVYNPLSPLLHTVPMVHVRRDIPTSLFIATVPGILQNSTVDEITTKFSVAGETNLKSLAVTFGKSQLNRVIKPFTSQNATFKSSRPEAKVFGGKDEKGNENPYSPRLFDPQPLSMRGVPNRNIVANMKSQILNTARNKIRDIFKQSPIAQSAENNKQDIHSGRATDLFTAAQKFRENFDKGTNTSPNKGARSRFYSNYLDEHATPWLDDQDYTKNSAEPGKTELKDNINTNTISYKITNTASEISKPIDTSFVKSNDIIQFIFTHHTDKVQFRALLSSIKESVKTEFDEKRYVGRTERFVTYGGAKRSVSLSFNVVAFSEAELKGVWSKINFLTGLAYPTGIKNGFMVPPLFNMTVGGLYDAQPCYLDSLDYDFLDESITFDIDKEVPFAVNVSMQIQLLEKRSKFYNSPFYAITEGKAT